MILLNVSEPFTLLLMLIATVLLVFLSQEIKKSAIAAIALFAYLVLLIIHVVQLSTLSQEFIDMVPIISRCIAIDFIFVFITFFSYLWVDDIEAKATGKKSIDNSLDWFWKKV